MTTTQKRLRELRDRQSRERQRMVELSRADELTDETRAELDTVERGTPDLERQIRAAVLAVETEDADSTIETRNREPDAERRERLELRSKASLGRYLAGHGRTLTGAEAELSQAAGLADGQIPIELWDVPRETRADDRETRAITAAPGTVGLNLDPLRPLIFAPSVVDALRIEMPSVESGTFATGTITTAAVADAVAKGAEVPEDAAAFTVATTTPHRVGASLNLAAEDVAAVGQANFEGLLREHLSLVLSDHLDALVLNGDTATDVNETLGLFARLTNPAAPAAGAAGWAQFLELYASGVDGLWAEDVSDVSLLLGLASYRLALLTYRSVETDLSVVAFGRAQSGGLRTNKRMPDKAAHVQQGILTRKGRPSMRTAVAPHWGYVSVDDIYSGARKGERRYVVSVLVGDLILVQPSVYSQIALRVSV